jgi:GntR family transcriptional regulator
MYGVAGSTVSKAIRILEDEGFVRGQVGKGVFVRSKQPFVIAATAYKEPSPRGYKYDLLQVQEVTPTKEVAQALRLGDGERVILRRRLLRWDGEPVEMSSSFYPLSFAAGTPLARKGKIPGGAPQILADLGLPERAFEDRVSVRQPLKEEIDALGLPLDVPVFRQFRVVYTDDERPVEVSILIKGGHLFELLYRQPVLAEDDAKQ